MLSFEKLETSNNDLAPYWAQAIGNAAKLPHYEAPIGHPHWIGRVPDHMSKPAPRHSDGSIEYASREWAGVGGALDWIRKTDGLETVFHNDLAYQVHGTDLIALDTATMRFVICEAKGTAKPIPPSPLRLLRHTKRTGRQLSWEWCYQTIFNLSSNPETAPAFLAVAPSLLMGEVSRMVSVSRTSSETGQRRILETRVWREKELQKHAWLRQNETGPGLKKLFVELRAECFEG